jgi:essential nuclear protein 1
MPKSSHQTKRNKPYEKKAKRAPSPNTDFVDAKTSKKILDMAREQQQEYEEEQMSDSALKKPLPSFSADVASDESEDEDYETYRFGVTGEDIKDVGLDPADQAILDRFSQLSKPRANLASTILAKIAQAEQAEQDEEDEEEDDDALTPFRKRPLPPGMNPKVVDVYQKVGLLLSRYKSGKLPKAFKIIPTFANWEDILYLTAPDLWTPHAMFQATRIFVSCKDNIAQRFFNLVLLDRVRAEVQEKKKLDVHLYLALKKALFRPAAFFKGILLPMVETGATLREAVIVGSVLTKTSIPVLHSSAVLLKLAEMEYSGPVSLLLRILLDKKYALPYKVLDSLVVHFVKQEGQRLPVLWHQSLLVFAQRYKTDLTKEQKSGLMKLLRANYHPQISQEIRRELENTANRGDVVEEKEDAMIIL